MALAAPMALTLGPRKQATEEAAKAAGGKGGKAAAQKVGDPSDVAVPKGDLPPNVREPPRRSSSCGPVRSLESGGGEQQQSAQPERSPNPPPSSSAAAILLDGVPGGGRLQYVAGVAAQNLPLQFRVLAVGQTSPLLLPRGLSLSDDGVYRRRRLACHPS